MPLTRRRVLQVTGLAAAVLAAGPRLLARVAAATPVGQWAAGDAHVHTDHSSDGSLPRQGLDRGGPGDTPVQSQLALGAAGGLDWMALTDHRTYTQHWDPQWTSDLLLLLPGEEEANGKPHATVVGAIDTLVDGAQPKDSADFRHLQQSVWDVHAQDAVWGTAHPQDGEYDSTGPGEGTVNANASTIGVDTVEAGNRVVDPDPDLDYCENRWNAGFRFGLTTSSDSPGVPDGVQRAVGGGHDIGVLVSRLGVSAHRHRRRPRTGRAADGGQDLPAVRVGAVRRLPPR